MALAAALTAAAAPAAAQFAAPRPAPRPATQTASINLIGLPFGVVSAEYERAIGPDGLAFGLGGTTSFDDNNVNNAFEDYSEDGRFSSLQAKLKYYPSARGLRGFAVGVTGGLASARGSNVRVTYVNNLTPPVYDRTRTTITRPTVGTVLDYNFLLGPRQRFLVGLGVGARRVLGSRVDRTNRFSSDSPDYTYTTAGLGRTLFDGRLQVGIGF